MRRIVLFIASLIVINSQAQDVQLASDIWPPFTDYEDKVHYAQDIVLEALRRTGQEADVNIIAFGDVISGLRNSEFDGSAALWKNSERAELLVFSKPYLENRLVLVGSKGSPVNFTSLKDLRGKKLAVVAKYDYGPELFNLQTLKIIKGQTDQECLNMLLAGKVDYILLDNLYAHHLNEYQQEEVSKYLAVGKRPLLNKPLHFALRKDFPDAEKIIALFNEAIEGMIKDGSYNELLNISWILADIDKDGTQEVILGGDKAGENPPDNIYQIILGSDPSTNDKSKEYYIQGKEYNNWQAIPEQFKMQPFNNSNNINILKLELNKN